jgi:hypothetical protein
MYTLVGVKNQKNPNPKSYKSAPSGKKTDNYRRRHPIYEYAPTVYTSSTTMGYTMPALTSTSSPMMVTQISSTSALAIPRCW